FLYFCTLAKWAVFYSYFKKGLKALYYKALSHFLATIFLLCQNNHNGLKKQHKIMFIKDFLNKKSC
ncbi:hypothetical protein, partial [Gallibacterium anatis]|uniref:hypothetical protein n=1 Tax=Gallibacterium anatis TaxID=750 RepID=UPI003A51F177